MLNECCQKPANLFKGIVATFLAVAMIISGFWWINSSAKSINQVALKASDNTKPLVGYCPTMRAHLKLLNQDYYDFLMLPSSAEALNQLQQKKVDLALIGRKALSDEISNEIQEKLLIDGYTLVGLEKNQLETDQLSDYIIHSHHPLEKITHLFEIDQQIIQHDDLQASLSQRSKDELSVIKWSEYDEQLALITLTVNQIKVLAFRSPHLYYFEDSADNIKLAQE